MMDAYFPQRQYGLFCRETNTDPPPPHEKRISHCYSFFSIYANVRAFRTPMLRHPRSHIPSCGKTAAKEIVFQMKCSYLGTTVNAGIVKSSNLPPPTLFSDVFPENSIKNPVSCEHNVTIKGQAFIIQFATQGGCSDEGRDANPCKSLALRAIQCV